MSPAKPWQPLGTNYLGPQTPNHTGPTSNVPGQAPPYGWSPELAAAIKAQEGNVTGGFPAQAGPVGAALGSAAANAASGIAAQLPQPGTQAPGGGVQGETTDVGAGEGAPAAAPAGDLSGFQDPYVAQKAAFEQGYQNTIPQLEAIRQLYANQIQGYGNDAQAQAGTAQTGIQGALAAAQAQNAQAAQKSSADLASQGFNPAQFNAQAASQQGLLANQGNLQDTLSKRLAQVEGQKTQGDLTATALASQGARQGLEQTHLTGQAAYTDKTAAAKNAYQENLAATAAKEADQQRQDARAAMQAAATRAAGGGSKGALTEFQKAEIARWGTTDQAAAGKAADAQRVADEKGKGYANLVGSIKGSANAMDTARRLQLGAANPNDPHALTPDKVMTLLKDQGMSGAEIEQAMQNFYAQYPIANVPLSSDVGGNGRALTGGR